MAEETKLTAKQFLEKAYPYDTGRWLAPEEVQGLETRKALWRSSVPTDSPHAPPTQEEQAIFLAQLMQETRNGDSYDSTKDGATDGSRNFSNLNLNQDMLSNFGGLEALKRPAPSLPAADQEAYNKALHRFNEDPSIPRIIEAALVVMRNEGTERYLYFTRGGRSGFENPREGEEKMFASSIRDTARHLLEDPSRMSNNLRYAHDIHHI